jgi:hypothetical protein
MSRNFEELIDLYFEGKMTSTEQIDFLRLVEDTPALRELVEAEEFIRGTIHADMAEIPQISSEPSAHLLDQLASSHQLSLSSQGAEQAVEQSVQTVTSGSSNFLSSLGLKSLATAGQNMLGIGAGVLKLAAGALTVAGVSVGVYLASLPERSSQDLLLGDTAIIRTLSAPPVPAVDTPVSPSGATIVKSSGNEQPAVRQAETPVPEPLYDFNGTELTPDLNKPPRINHIDSIALKAAVKKGKLSN